MVWARPGSATAEKIKPSNKARMFIIHQPAPHNSRLEAEVPRTAKIIFWIAFGGSPGGRRQAHFKKACAATGGPRAGLLAAAKRPARSRPFFPIEAILVSTARQPGHPSRNDSSRRP